MSESQKWFYLTAVVLTGGLFYLLSPVLTPFLMAALLAYMGDPLADRLESWGLSRSLSVTTVFVSLSLLALILLLVLVPMLQQQLALLVAKVPGYINWLQTQALPWIDKRFGLGGLSLDLGALEVYLQENWRSAGGNIKNLLSMISTSGLTLLAWVANLVLIPVVSFYLLRDWDILVSRLHALIPRHIEAEVVHLVKSSDEVLGAFLRGQLTVMLALGLIYTIGLWLVG